MVCGLGRKDLVGLRELLSDNRVYDYSWSFLLRPT